jgi:hypothetical protein
MEELAAAIKTNAGEAERSLSTLTSTSTDAIRNSAQDVERSLTAMSSGVTSVLKQNAGEVERTLLGVSAEVARSFVGKADEISTVVSTRASEMTRLLDEKSSGLLTALSGKSKEFTTEVTRVTDHAVKAIEAQGFSFTQTMMDNSDQIARLINKASDSATGTVTRSLKELQENTEQVTAAASSTVARSLREIQDMAKQSSDQAAAAVAASIRELQDVARTSTEGYSANVGRSLRELQEHAKETSETASATVTRRLRELQETTQSAVELSKQTAASAVAEMLETHGMLRSDTTALFERLREANTLLQEVLSGAHENMSSLENTLVTRVSDFVSTMNELTERSGAAGGQVEKHITSFHQVTTSVLGELSQLATQFDSHGRTLVQAVEIIEMSNRRTEGAINERRGSLETLVQALDGKTQDLEQRLKRFSGLLDESLEAASGRAREIARVVADSSIEGRRAIDESLQATVERSREIARVITDASTQSANAIGEQFELVRNTSEEERKRTDEMLRRVYEQTAGDASAMFRETTERFTQTLQGMKQMAAEMQRELETTRAELRRGILELPQETAESAAQMRRVIVDQIEALAELNRIVARHGRASDVAEPMRRAQREEQAGLRSEPPPPRPAPAPLPGPGPAPAARTEPSGARAESMRMEPPRSDAPRTDITGAPARRAESPSLSPAGGNGRGGWLSDLLSRASREETPVRTDERSPTPQRASEERPPRHAIESLDSLSVDIARMIDHDAAVELWERYKRGERNVFTRRLYTMQGQKTFEEIRKRYRADREFKQTVDRYVGEFERLLDEVSRDDRGQVVARTYLTSETGKVYLMLAHAAGRFGE